jgi:hypothetical protein
MAAFKNDGTVQYGSRVLTINSVAYIAENVTVSRPGITIERKSELDEPNGQVSYAGFVTGSATLQLASGSTVIPVQGLSFSTTFVTSIGSETFYLDSVDQPESQGSAKTVGISFRKTYA